MRTKLRDGERKILETRTHWVTVLRPFLVFSLAVALFVVSFVLLREANVWTRIARWACGVLLAVAAAFFFYAEWFRRRDIWAVTNFRVIDEQGILKLSSKESPLEKINNLSYEQSLIGRLLNFGNVEIQTAAEQGATVYRKVKGPKKLKDAVARAREDHGREIQRLFAGPAAEEPKRVCPFCAETVKAHARVCRFCGRDLPPQRS